MSDRYKIPAPKCRHVARGRVTAGSFDGAHASTHVCDRPECIADAKEWATAKTRLPATYYPFPPAYRNRVG